MQIIDGDIRLEVLPQIIFVVLMTEFTLLFAKGRGGRLKEARGRTPPFRPGSRIGAASLKHDMINQMNQDSRTTARSAFLQSIQTARFE